MSKHKASRSVAKAKPEPSVRLTVGMASCGVASGAREVADALQEQIRRGKLDIPVDITGCLGMCYREPLVEVHDDRLGRTVYGNVAPEQVTEIVARHLLEGKPVEEWVVQADWKASPDDSFFAKQKRVVLRNCGRINPERIDDYVARGGYGALEKVLAKLSPEQVIEEVSRSGLRGRGGAGFPTGRKWQFVREAPGNEKQVICNADEGDPGAFMDRGVLESDPHSVLEGMVIAACAVGASGGYIYVRAEYPLAVRRLAIALQQARERNFLGANILGSDFGFEVTIKQGAGAFVCGEETALIASLEGRRGMPRLRPPFPANEGLWRKPTLINNVETLANIPYIITEGAESIAHVGTETSKGTKVFALAGKINRGGMVEVPMGITIDEIVNQIGGGIRDGRAFKAVQIGGPSGGCIPAALAHTPIPYAH
jgi:NADH-quinone oxidoreductase subunit F